MVLRVAWSKNTIKAENRRQFRRFVHRTSLSVVHLFLIYFLLWKCVNEAAVAGVTQPVLYLMIFCRTVINLSRFALRQSLLRLLLSWYLHLFLLDISNNVMGNFQTYIFGSLIWCLVTMNVLFLLYKYNY